jgi:hypothetical protein
MRSNALSATAHLGPYPQIVSGMPKRVRPPKHARIKVKLDTIMGVAREMGRLIRLSYNGHLAPEELTRYVFALDKLRACLESAAIEANAVQAAQAAANAEPRIVNVRVVSIPSGHYLRADGSFAPMSAGMLQIEHEPAPEPEKPQLEEPAPAPAEPSAFANMTIEELKRMAGVSDVD